jgi:hypothetical protein
MEDDAPMVGKVSLLQQIDDARVVGQGGRDQRGRRVRRGPSCQRSGRRMLKGVTMAVLTWVETCCASRVHFPVSKITQNLCEHKEPISFGVTQFDNFFLDFIALYI